MTDEYTSYKERLGMAHKIELAPNSATYWARLFLGIFAQI